MTPLGTAAGTTDPYAAYGGQAATPPPPAADPYAAYGGRIAPGPTSTNPTAPPPRPTPAQDAISSDLLSNPQGEGLYQMKAPTGSTVAVPFSKVKHGALPMGYQFATPDETARYARDFHAAPVASWNDLLGDIEERPGWRHWLDPTTAFPEQAAGGMKGVATLAEGARKLLGLKPKEPDTLTQVAQRPNANAQEAGGELQENMGEFVSGEELLGLIGKTARSGEALNDAGKVAQMLEKYPQVARVLKVGMNAVKNIPELGQALLGAGQTFIKTGGDTAAAIESGLTTGAIGGGLRAAGAVGSAVKAGLAGPVEAAKPGAAEYAGVARGAIEPQLQAINASHELPVKMNQPGGEPAVTTGRTARPESAPPPIDIPKVLSETHDFKGAVERVTDINNAGYDQLDTASGGKFRQLNSQVAAAQKALWQGAEGAGEKYKNAIAQMDALINSTSGMTPKVRDALRDSWRATYQLDDIASAWDRNLKGVPGSTKASQAQTGINGKGLLTDLNRAVRMHGRGEIDKVLGPGGLETLEEIANANITNTQRVNFSQAMHNVVRSMSHGALLGGAAGHFAGSYPGGALLGAAAAGYPDTYKLVMDTMKSNPKIAQNFLFALKSGATPERYGPFIGSMISHALTKESNEQQQQQEQAK
jgi:hypothetical protein